MLLRIDTSQQTLQAWMKSNKCKDWSLYDVLDVSNDRLTDTDLLDVETILGWMTRCKTVDLSHNNFDGSATDFYTSTFHKAIYRLQHQRQIKLLVCGHEDLVHRPTRLVYTYHAV